MKQSSQTRLRNGAAGYLTLVLVTAGLVGSFAPGRLAAQDAAASTVALWLDDAPLKLVLEQIAGTEGVEVLVGSDVTGRIDGRLEGSRETVLAKLAVEHELSVHAAKDTVWFDAADSPVVSLVRLTPEETERAFSALDTVRPDGSVVQETEEGLVVSGTRAFVENARRRISALASAAARESSIIEQDSGPAIESVSDIPGFDVDYTSGSAS